MSAPIGCSRRARHIPLLHTSDLDPQDYARSTCFEAGYLVSTNAGWRSARPVIDAEACTGCLECYLYCPDGALFKVGDKNGPVSIAVDYDFCKGCGICVRVCRFGALSMISEREALAADPEDDDKGEVHTL